MSGPKFTRPQYTGLSGLGAMQESYHRLLQKLKTVLRIKDALQSIWSAFPENASDEAVKDYCKRLQACVSANGGYFGRMM